MIKIIFITLLFTVQVLSQFYNNEITLNKPNYCEYLRNDKKWLDKTIDYSFKQYNIEILKELNNERKKVDQMIYQLCNNDKYEL